MKIRLSVFLFLMTLIVASCSNNGNMPVGNNSNAVQVPAEARSIVEGNAPSDEAILDEMSRVPVAPMGGQTDFGRSGYDVYSVTFVWGSILGTSSTANSAAVDWSGDLSLFGAGEIRTVLPIDFEKGQDSILVDDVPETEAWMSTTNGDFDGLSFLVYVDKSQVIATIPRITFTTAPIVLEYDVTQLEKLLEFHAVDNSTGVAVFARKIAFRPCPEGTLEGNWMIGDAFGDSGIFRGMWLNDRGVPVGSYTGIWRRDTSVFGGGTMEGKVYATNAAVTSSDQVIAVLRGKFFYDDPRLCPTCGQGHGVFEGSFWFRNDTIADTRPDGAFEGEFGSLTTPLSVVMPMAGKWKVNCPNITSNDPSTIP